MKTTDLPMTRHVASAPATAPSPTSSDLAATRLGSVDVLRGFTMAWIIGGDGIAWSFREMALGKTGLIADIGRGLGDQLSHVRWEGFRFYDLIFPLLIFVAGVTIVLSLPRIVARDGKAAALKRVLRRAGLLFVLGVVYYGGLSVPFPEVRLLGVLQRIAICYLVAAILFLHIGPRGLAIITAAILIGYWALLAWTPVPGVGPPSFAPNVNLAVWVDANFLPGRRWYGTWDPEGLLTTLPAIANGLIGVLAGLLLVRPDLSAPAKSRALVLTGLGLAATGWLWSFQFPLIKMLWTSSYVLVTGGLSVALLGVMHEVVDVRGHRAWGTVFAWIGANAILLYLLNRIVGFKLLAERAVGGDVSAFFDHLLAPGTGRLIAHATGLGLAILLARLLYQKRIFLRV